ncbi:MAG TPA: TetR family transcriptional regulator [Micromonosporaceae bacterium]
MTRTGRRRGSPDTREAILAAARDAFAAHGFDGTSIRAIAGAAGVDPALVHHYFGTKEELFLATIRSPIDPADLLPKVLDGDLDGLGERLVRTFVSVWDDPVTGPAAVAVFRTGMRHDWSQRILREFLTTQILRRVLARLDIDAAEAPLRGALIASQMGGLAVIRYILRVEPLASAPADQVVALIAPTVQRYLTGPLPAASVPTAPHSPNAQN